MNLNSLVFLLVLNNIKTILEKTKVLSKQNSKNQYLNKRGGTGFILMIIVIVQALVIILNRKQKKINRNVNVKSFCIILFSYYGVTERIKLIIALSSSIEGEIFQLPLFKRKMKRRE